MALNAESLCLTLCYKKQQKTHFWTSLLLLPGLHIEKYPPAEYSHYLHFAYYCVKHIQVAITKHWLGTPLSILWPVTAEQAYRFQPYPCSFVTDMNVYKLQGLCYTHCGPTSISFLTASVNDFITHLYDFFSFLSSGSGH